MSMRTTCPLDCPDRCAVLCEVEERGAAPPAVRLSGDPDHPFTLGVLCRKIHRHPDRLAAPERIRQPWMRVGGRHGVFRPASWDEALGAAAEAISRARDLDPASVFMHKGAGCMGASKDFAPYVFGLIGARTAEGSLCAAAGDAAVAADAGVVEMNDPAQIKAADVVVLWGKNPRASSVHTAGRVVAARRRGARVIAITPDREGLQGLADHVISIRPGGDRFLALAALRLLLESPGDVVAGGGGAPAEAARRAEPPWDKAENRAEFEAMLARHSVAELLAACGVSETDARLLADAYASSRRVATISGWGLQRYRHGGEAVRALHALAFLAGTIGREGGGFYYVNGPARRLTPVQDILARQGHALPPGVPPLKLGLLGRQIPLAEPPVRVAWLASINIVNQGPDVSALRRAFAGIETVVAVEAFWTETARCASIVLPPALWLEEEDVAASYWRDQLGAVRRVVPAPQGCRTDFEILQDLASRLRLEHPYRSLDDWLRDRLPADGPSLEELRAHGWRDMAPDPVAFRHGFGHSGGRFRLLESLSPSEPPDAEYPLQLLTLIRGSATHSQMLPHEMAEPLPLRLHPDTAADLGLSEGAPARVTSRVGSIEGVVRFDPGLHREAVACPRGGWVECGQGVNLATEAVLTDMGDGTAYYSTRVRVQPAHTDWRSGS